MMLKVFSENSCPTDNNNNIIIIIIMSFTFISFSYEDIGGVF